MLPFYGSGWGRSIPNCNPHVSFYLFIPRGSFAKTFHYFRIRHFNVGSLGGRSDGGIWSEDRLGRGLSSGRLLEEGHIPEAEPLPDDEQVHVNLFIYFLPEELKWGG